MPVPPSCTHFSTSPPRRHPRVAWLVAIGVLSLFAVWVPSVGAGVVLYTFEAPQFTAGETVPLVDRAPNVGSAAFLATFDSTPAGGSGFRVDNFVANSLFSGMSLVDATGAPTDPLTLTFNTPVTEIQVAFATISSGRLELVTPVGTTSVNSMIVGGNFPGGTLVFSSLTPFTTAQFRAFTTADVPMEFALDNLQLTTVEPTAVPEPAGVILAAVGAMGFYGAARRRRSA